MEARLREYRAQRRRQELIENTKEKIVQSKQKVYNFLIPKFFREMSKEKKEEEVLLLEDEEPIQEQLQEIEQEELEPESLEEPEDVQEETWRYCLTKWGIYFAIWITLYLFFLKLQFGAVFFVISLLIGICLNTRTKPKKRGEVSAYSVFNRNCQSIDGTLKAEQLEKQMLYGMAAPQMF